MGGLNHLFVEIARRPRRGFQERVLQIFLVKRFDWYGAPDLDRFLVLRLDWDRFPDLGSGLCSFMTRLALGLRSYLRSLLQFGWSHSRPFDLRLFPVPAVEPVRVSVSA